MAQTPENGLCFESQTAHMKNLFVLIVSLICLASCNNSVKGIFVKKTAREKYEDRVDKLYPDEGRAWKNAGTLALLQPLTIAAPYAEIGSLHGDSADVSSFRFSVKAGQKIQVKLTKLDTPFTAYTELWEVAADGTPKFLNIADTAFGQLEQPSLQAGEYIVRMQPELKARGRYKFSLLLSPLLGNPIYPGVKNNIGSLWGDSRDAGGRSHEGIDIFAKKGSYVVAVADGVVRRIGDGGIGGKVVWLSPDDYDISIYYAHLDTQLVQSGQQVKKGDVLGTVGNTGNAKFTPAHLHFGVYSGYGAVDPLAFVQDVKPAADPKGSDKLNSWFKTMAKSKLYPSPEKKNALVITDALNLKTQSISGSFYRVILENGMRGFVPEADIKNKTKL